MNEEKNTHSDIDEVIKRYEEETKEKLPTPPEINKGRKEKKKIKIPKINSKILIGIAAVILGIILFFVFGKKKSNKKIIRQKQIAAKKINPIKEVDGIPVFGMPKKIDSLNADGINTKIYKVKATIRNIQLFYQKMLTEKGYIIDTFKETKGRVLKFKKGSSEVVVNIIPEGEETVILLSYKK